MRDCSKRCVIYILKLPLLMVSFCWWILKKSIIRDGKWSSKRRRRRLGREDPRPLSPGPEVSLNIKSTTNTTHHERLYIGWSKKLISYFNQFFFLWTVVLDVHAYNNHCMDLLDTNGCNLYSLILYEFIFWWIELEIVTETDGCEFFSSKKTCRASWMSDDHGLIWTWRELNWTELNKRIMLRAWRRYARKVCKSSGKSATLSSLQGRGVSLLVLPKNKLNVTSSSSLSRASLILLCCRSSATASFMLSSSVRPF